MVAEDVVISDSAVPSQRESHAATVTVRPSKM